MRTPIPALLLALFLSLVSCGGDSDSRAVFVVRTSTSTVSGAIEPIVEGIWIVHWASEALMGATELARFRNSDGDATDEVAVATRADLPAEFPLGVAASRAAVVVGQIYLEVSEAADGVDWNGTNGMADRVLLHWSQTTGTLTLVDTLSVNPGAVPFVNTSGRLYYVAAPTVALVGDETSVFYVESTAPTTPVRVSGMAGAGTLDPVLLGEREGLIFLLADETRELRNLNGDGDSMDPFVLSLLDGTDRNAPRADMGLALEGLLVPFAARTLGTGDWRVAVLVDEADQGNTNFNDPGLFPGPIVPASCAGTPDADSADQVLFYLDFLDVLANVSQPVNTGLAGRDRILLSVNGVATLSDETDANCNLNEDLDTADTVARWVSFGAGALPPSDAAELHALNTTLPGGSMGMSLLQELFVAVVDEAADSRDLDGKPVDHDLVSWLDPLDGATAGWTFAHQHPTLAGLGTGVFEDVDGDGIGDPFIGASQPYAGATWMSAEEQRGRLTVTFEERVPGLNLNTNLRCGLLRKDNDATDALPVWLNHAGGYLDFDGLGYSVDPANAGIVAAGGHAFFRLSEAQDNIDHNGDGVLDDMILARNPLGTCDPVLMAIASRIPGPVIVSKGDLSAAFFTDETLTGVDYNGDGDALDLVFSYFLL